MNTSPVSGREYPSRYNAERTTGNAASGTHNYMDLMEKVRGKQDSGSALDELGRQTLELLEDFKEQHEEKAEGEKLDALLGTKDPDEDFWEARARREEEFQALRSEQARKERILKRLRSGEPVSAAELLFL